jgi:hypothetical protein
MKKISRIRFNPATREIEVEGSEKFVKTYFDKLQERMSGFTEKIWKRRKVEKVHVEKKVKKVKHEGPSKKRVTNISSIVTLVQASAEGISTSALKEKTDLSERQIWSIVNRAAKEGKIKKLKRGLYGPA